MVNKSEENFFKALENLLANHLGFQISKTVERSTIINDVGELEEHVKIDINVQPFIQTSSITINITLDQKNNLLNKF